MGKRAIIFLFVLILALVVSCASPEDKETATENTATTKITENSTETSTPTETEEKDEVKTETLPLTKCAAEWVCLSSIYKIYRNEDCTLNQKTECKLGCQEGKCRAAETCEPGFKCRNDHQRGYQDAVCAWSNEKECELGCKDNDCVAPVETSAITTANSNMVENKTSGCTEGWKCASAEYKAYQESDCFIREKIFCTKGCEQGQCK